VRSSCCSSLFLSLSLEPIDAIRTRTFFSASGQENHRSRLIDGRPVAAEWYSGSSRSGPTLKACTVRFRSTSAAISPTDTELFPTSDADPAMIMER